MKNFSIKLVKKVKKLKYNSSVLQLNFGLAAVFLFMINYIMYMMKGD